jgi:hypothetical protein
VAGNTDDGWDQSELRVIGNPRIATLHGPDVVGLFASRPCFGFGLALLIARLIFRGK